MAVKSVPNEPLSRLGADLRFAPVSMPLTVEKTINFNHGAFELNSERMFPPFTAGKASESE